MQCSPSQLVPQGPGVQEQYQGCSVAGAAVGAHSVEGSAYLGASYSKCLLPSPTMERILK